jgi:hypothetical protein
LYSEIKELQSFVKTSLSYKPIDRLKVYQIHTHKEIQPKEAALRVVDPEDLQCAKAFEKMGKF